MIPVGSVHILDTLEEAGHFFCEEDNRTNKNCGSPLHYEQFRWDTTICVDA